MKQPNEDYSLLDVHFIDELHDNTSVEHELASHEHLNHIDAQIGNSDPSHPHAVISSISSNWK